MSEDDNTKRAICSVTGDGVTRSVLYITNYNATKFLQTLRVHES